MALTRITKGVIKPNENYDTHNINSTGIVTAVGANFTGNVSVGGVLTYEDVTNIDSVGVITARQGIFIDDSITHIGDTNTKIRFPAADTISFETAGSERIRITDDGRIGINDNTPNDYELDILKRPAATDAQIRLYNNGTASSNDTVMRYQIGGTTANNFIYFGDSADTNVGQIRYSHSNNFLSIHTNAAERLRILSDGKVGIGTISPHHGLHFFKDGGDSVITIESTGNGNHSALEFMRTSSGGDSKGAGSIYVTGDTSASEARMHFGVGHNIGHGQLPRMTIMGNGEVGIGTDNPGSILDVRQENDGGSAQIMLYNTDNDNTTTQTAGLFMSPDSRAYAYAGLSVKKEVADMSSNAGRDVSLVLNVTENNSQVEAVHIASSGSVGIGTNSPYNVGLDVRFPLTTVATFSSLANGTQGANVSIIHTKSGITDNDKVGQISFSGGALGNATTYAQIRTIATDISNKKGDIAFYMRNGNNTTGSLIDDERLRITSDGKIGIGTDSPDSDAYIHIVGPDNGKIILEDNDNNGANLRKNYIGIQGSDNLILAADEADLGTSSSIRFRIDNTEKACIDNSGRIGIGTNSPVRPLHIHAADCRIRLEDAGVATDVELQNSSGDAVLTTNGASNLRLQTNNTERLRITSDGKVGINVTDPDAALETVSNATNGKNAYLGGQYNDGGQTAVRRIEFGTTNYRNYIQGQQGSGGSSFSNSDLLLNPNGGDVGISVTDPDAKLEVRDSAATGFIVRCTNTQSTNTNKALRVRNNSDTNTFHVSHKGQGYFADSIGISTSEPVSKLEVRGDINFQNNALISNFDSNGVGGTNIDHIWHSDAPNYGKGGTWNFVSDTAYKATGNSAIQIGYLVNSGGGHLIGDVGIGLTTISRGPLHVHENSSDDCEIHLTNNDTGTTSSDGLTIFTDTDTSGVWCREDVPFDIATAGTRSIRLHSTGGLSINTTSKSTNCMLQVDNHGDRDTGTTPNESQYVCFFDNHFTGSGGTLSANRAKAGMRIDNEFSCSTPSTSTTGNRFSVYGIYNDIQSTKYAYVNDGIYSFVKSTADNQPSSSGSTTIRGVYGYAQGYLTNSSQNVHIYGGYFLGYRGGSVTNGHAYGVYARAHNTNGSNNTGDLTGVYSEWEQDDSTTITNAYAFRGYGDRDAGTITNGYILYGSFGGDSSITNRWGIYINDSAKNRLGGDLEVVGTLTKGTDNFRIPHPLVGLTTTKDLVHSVIEGPQLDLIYRGKVDLVGGTATINIDTKAGMTEGTFVALCRDIQCFTSNETGWTNVKGSVTGNKITIIAQDNSCTDTISWMVVGERQDDNAKGATCTDNDGNLILEPDKRTDLNDKYQAECEKNEYNES